MSEVHSLSTALHLGQSVYSEHSDSDHNKDNSSDSDDRGESPQQFTGEEKSHPGYIEGDPELAEELSRYNGSSFENARTLSRILTQADKLIEEANDTDKALPTMGSGKTYPPPVPDREAFSVSFDGPNDPTHPHNHSFRRKLINSFCVAFSAFCVSVGSAIFSQAANDVMKKFHVGATTVTLTTSLYVMGFATGPTVYGPLSEIYGRKTMMVLAAFGYTIFSFGVATAQNLETIMLCRFFCGFVGSASFVIAPAVMADTFSAKDRGRAMAVFAMVLFGGPMLAPIIGAFTVKNSSLGWRWTQYFCGIIGSVSTLVNLFLLDETHHPMILVKKAETLRRRTGNWGIFAPHEEISLSFKEIVEKTLTRPVIMLATEPILQMIGIYNAFIYGMLYLFLTAIPFIFSEKYQFMPGVAELPYLAMFIGILLGSGVILLFDRKYIRVMEENGGKPIPEERLPPMMLGGFFFTGGLFWLGWTGQYADHIHWIVPVIGSAFVGFGLILVFLPCLTYIVDCYLVVSASALAGNTLLRSTFGAVFPLFARQMFNSLGVNWGCTLVGCVALVMIPLPFIFYKYGGSFRERSKFAFVLS